MILYLILFLALFLFFYGFFIYPLLLWVIDRIFNNKTRGVLSDHSEGVTVVISVKNETNNIVNKLHNLFSLDINDLLLEVIVVSDGSSDNTPALVKKYPSNNIRVIISDTNNGKPVSLNTALSIAKFNRVLFADSRQIFDSKVVAELIDSLSVPNVACVSGELFPKRSNKGIGTGVDLYWKIEKFIRRVESDLYSSVGCTGAIYAIKPSSYFPIPSDTLLDDVVIPMKALINGQMVKFQTGAVAYDYQALDRSLEAKRKTRTIGGNFQMLFRYPEFLFNRQLIISFFYFSHKISRLVSPFAILLACILLFVLLPTLYLRLCFLLMLVIGLIILRFVKLNLFVKLKAFLFLNSMVFKGLIYYIRAGYKKGW